MPEHSSFRSLIAAFGLAMALLIASPQVSAQVNVIYSFGANPSDGQTPYTSFLIADPAGNLYGTTTETVSSPSFGTVFQLSPQPGGWSEKILFTFGGTDGWNSGTSSGLVRDSAGNLYGITFVGGFFGPFPQDGVAFELSPSLGSWKYKILWQFGAYTGDGINPTGSLIRDASGDLYGVTNLGGTNGDGAVFRLHLSPLTGMWTEKILFSFNGTNGENPNGPLLMDAAGNLFGTTYNGGSAGLGTVYELKHIPGGGYQQQVIHSFLGSPDGVNPECSLILLSGNLYGTTHNGGFNGDGTVFQLVPQAGGWAWGVIHSFNQSTGDGATPRSGLTVVNGGLYGTTEDGGSTSAGTVFGLTQPGGSWSETFLTSFIDAADQATFPSGGLLLYTDGNLYGTAQGGTNGVGSTYEISP